jgi:hypothetical protein
VVTVVQPAAFVIVILIVTGPFPPLEKVIVGVPAPAVIVPFETFHVYVAPGPASVTDAT